MRAGRPYYFVGANINYGDAYGVRDESLKGIQSELDRLQGLGVSNVRVAINPAAYGSRIAMENDLAELDQLLDELAKRNMVAVLYLHNLVDEWASRVRSAAGKTAPSSTRNPSPAAFGREWLSSILTRVNTINGRTYSEDTAIMSWQLPGAPSTSVGRSDGQLDAYRQWLRQTLSFIKSIDRNHLVSVAGSALVGGVGDVQRYIAAYQDTGLDYLTMPLRPELAGRSSAIGSNDEVTDALVSIKAVILRQIQLAKAMGIPLVVDELGVWRAASAWSVGESSDALLLFYRELYGFIEQQAMLGQPIVGTYVMPHAQNTAAAQGTGELGQAGPTVARGPSVEPIGSVMNLDNGMANAVAAHARAMSAL